MNATTSSTGVVDPVCGMTIDPANAVGSSSFEGKTYYFCSRACESKFDAAPARDVAVASSAEPATSCCSTVHARG